MKVQALACVQAAMISVSVGGSSFAAGSRPRAMFSRMEPWKRAGSCCTRAIWRR